MQAKFWCADPAAAARACLELCPQDAARSISIADDVRRHRFLFRDHWEMERTHQPVQFGPAVTDIDWGCVPAGDPEWLYAMNRHTCFVNLGKARLYTGREEYAETFAALISDWIDRVPLTEASRANTWRSLEAGLRCETWLRALRLFTGSPHLTDALRRKIDDCLLVHGEYLARASDDFHRLSNWGVLQDHGLYLLGLYFDRSEWRDLAVRRVDENLHCAVFRDGTHWEQSPMYHCEVLHCAMDLVLAAAQNHQPLPERLTENVRRMCRALAAWVKPNGRLLLQSDSDDTDARDLLALGALLFRDPLLRAAAGEALFEETLWDWGVQARSEYAALPCADGAPASAALTDSGNVMLRSPSGAWVHMHCGCLGSGHGHADLLHVDAGIAGEDVLTDAGRYSYVNTPLRRQLKQPAAHNTTRVDGADFSECLDSWGYSRLAVPVKGQHTFTEAVDYADGAHLGYWDRGVFVTRKLVFLKEWGVLLIADQFWGKGRHEYEQHFHFGKGQTIFLGRSMIWKGQRAAARLLCLGTGLQLTQDRGPHSADYNLLTQTDTLTVRRSGEDFGWFMTVLSMDDGAAQPVQAELLPVRKLCAGTLLTDREAQAVRIRKNGGERVVLLCHSEVISEVDLLAAGGYSGYGKALVFSPQKREGLCLTW